MAKDAPAGRTARRAMCALGMVVAMLAACGGKSRAPRKMPKALPSQAPVEATAASDNGEDYRKVGGTPIAPVVINDDPAPVAQPVAEQQAGRPATLNGDPNGLTRDTLNRAIQGSMGSLASCFSSLSQDPMVAVSFEADPSGRPSLVRINGAPPDAERCIRNIVQAIRFPSFDGRGVQVDLPLSFHRVGRAQSAPPQAAQAPAAPPLFLQP